MEKPENIKQIARHLAMMQKQMALMMDVINGMLDEQRPAKKPRPTVTLEANGRKLTVGRKK